ncbi:MAG: GNAT family N-acetyltransferase [Clostridiales bacterium]|nr:GNAT family N-acetyltransferase [Clostridiales bacterium]
MHERIILRILDESQEEAVRAIRREDVIEDFVDTAETILELHHYGKEHGCLGHTFAIYADGICIGVLLLGEAIPWETDPPEMQGMPFYRLMGFVLDKTYRGKGIGAYALEEAIQWCYRDFGVRPIALGVHRDNHRAEAFYLRHGFRKTEAMEGNDYYFLRYPQKEK